MNQKIKQLISRLNAAHPAAGSFTRFQAADTIEAQAKLLDQALEAMGSALAQAAFEKHPFRMWQHEAEKSVAAIKQFKEQK